MKKLALLLLLSGVNYTAVAEEKLGLGFYVSSGWNTISIPYQINNDWRIEPFFEYAKNKSKNDAEDLDDYEYFYQYDSERYRLGVSLDRVLISKDKLSLYSGASLAYEVQSDSYHSVRESGYDNTSNNQKTRRLSDRSSELDGYQAGLIFGLQYELFKNIELAGEITLNYQDLQGDGKDRELTKSVNIDKADASNNSTTESIDLEKSDKEESGYHTASRLIVRFYF